MTRGWLTLTACAAVASMAMAVTARAQAVTETVHVVIGGGPMAGTYDASSMKGGCSTGANGPGSWGNAFSDVKATERQLGALSLIVPSASAAAAGTAQFFVQFRLGSILGKNTEYTVESRPNQKAAGSGTVTVAASGTTARVTIDAKTADGVEVKATIDCKTVTHL